MAKTTLRAYDRDIEALIEQNQLEQAIAHAKHILKFFPKHIQTYKLLGKAYLESQRYGDAADVFQRVLSAIPDDFVSHVGMSIIREDEGNLDEAIWHMERAFEIQPANSAIQGELRRLYGRRDGMEPPKVRLTRGALARMYLKGELYQQAIAELRAALAEDPQRPDLLAMLAQAYLSSGQRVEAADTCSILLKKAPYCLEANRILAQILANTERADEAQIYRQRVSGLDPYSAFISPTTPTSDKVSDTVIPIEKLVWSPGQPVMGMPGQPEWAASLGVDLGTAPKEKEALPEWLADQPATPAAPEPVADTASGIPPFAAAPPVSEEQTGEAIPGWMKEAGWQSTTGEEEPSAQVFEDRGMDIPAPDELAPANIPDWLQEMAPQAPGQVGETLGEEPEAPPPVEAESDAFTWLQEAPPGPTDSVATWLEEKTPETPKTAAFEMEAEAGEMPDWLKDLGQQEPATPGEVPPPSKQAEAVFEEPELSAKKEEAAPVELPDWLKPEGEIAAEETTLPAAKEAPVWPGKSSVELSKPEEAPTGPAPSPEEAAFAWLESLAAKQGADEALLLKPEDRLAEPPEWVREAAATQPVEEPPTPEAEPVLPTWLKEEPSEATMAETGSLAETPEWLSELQPPAAIPPEEPTAISEIELPAEPALEVPSWETPTPMGQVEEPVTAEPAGMPDWLRELGQVSASVEPAEEEAEVPFEAAAVEGEGAISELPDWLKQAEPSSEEAVEGAGLPEWLMQAKPKEEEAEVPGIPEWLPEAEVQPEAAEAEVPAWFAEAEAVPESLEGLPVSEISEAQPIEEAELPGWLFEVKPHVEPAEAAGELPEWIPAGAPLSEQELTLDMLFGPRVMAPREEGVPPAEVAPVEEAVPISDTQPTRIKPVEEPAEPFVTAKLPEAEPEKPEVPEWLRGVEAPAEAPIEMTAAGPGSPMDDEAAFAWLEGLAARMGADEAMLLSPEERREEPPEWVQKAAEAAAEAPLEEIQPEVPVSGFEAVPAGEPATEAEIQPVEAFAFEERPVEAEMAPTEEFGFEELPAEAEIQPVEAVAAEEIPVEAQIPPAEEFVFEEIPLEAGVPPAEGFVFEEIPFEAEALPAEELPIEAALFTELEGITPVEERMEEAPAIEEAPAEAVEPMAGLILEETEPVSEEAPPELPSWLAGAEAAQPAEEEAAWTPPEEEAEVELEQPIPAETQLAAEPFRLEEIEAVQLDLNRAGLSELERLPGVGFTRAQAIITYRQAFGAFSSVDDLINIAGFDPSLVDSLKRHLTIAEAQPVEALAEGVDIHQVTLIQARNALIQSDTNKALLHYLNLIRAQQLLPEVIQDLNEALYRFPVDISIWEALGDAHVRAGHLQESLDAYTKAEELIR